MDPCHSVSPRSPALTSAVTVAHLIRNIEQLKNKDKLISQLEKDLGQQWVAAQLAALERESGEGAHALSHPSSALPGDSDDPTVTWTPTSTPTTGGVEDGWSTDVENSTPGKQDLPNKLKDLKARNKELVDKCRAYLYRTKELTAQNRAYKDSSDKVLHENKKMQELLEHSKLNILQLTRQLIEQKAEKSNLENQSSLVEEIKKKMMEDHKTIAALKQACSEKDRRIELIQHRKKRRRLMTPAEKKLGIRETYYGYDEDKSMDSDASFSSVSHSTVSDDDVWDDVMSREETEGQYRRLMLEHLQLQRSHALLQKQGEHIQDPQREALAKMALQNDLFNAQCRIEKLEQMINEIGEGEVLMLLKEREAMLANTKEAQEKACFWENQSRRLQHELNKAVERSEELEFQLMEIENSEDDRKNSSCNENTQDQPLDYHELNEQLAETSQWLREAEVRMDDLRKELAVLLKGKGREGDAVLKKLEKIQNEDKKHAASLESMANELQMKVISLQEEKNSLLDSLKLKGIKPGKVDNSFSASAAREKQENLELKAELTKLIHSENKLIEERIHLQDELEDWKTQYEYLKQQLDILTKSQPTHTEDYSVRSAAINSTLTRKPSKSKPRGGESPSQSKRRKSSQDEPSSMDVSDGLSKESILRRSFSSCENLQTMAGCVGDTGDMRSRVRVLEKDLEKMKDENYNLQDQLKQSALEKSSEAEADQQILMDKVRGLEAELDLMKRENVHLAHKLKQRIEEFNDSQDELNPRLSELEEYCEDLQERLHAAEMAERQMREKLRLVEGSIDDAETSELAVREKYEELLARDAEAKQQIRQLQRTGHELRDLILDKDIMEQALRDKVDFLQKAEAASVKRIEELEAIEKDLRDQLEMKLDSKNVCQREVHKIQELKHQITFLETDNKAMSARIAELEENEETLRENWRRVADEDFNRTQSLEEKVKMLEGVNRDLKAKLMDAQEYFVINTVRPTENSLAAELAMSQSRLGASVDSVDGFRGDGEEPKPDPEKKTLVEKLRKLERKLSDVSEKKNTEIETLQEKIVSLRENEVKLSETISEMEMTERELRAKLALYESSEVTVEKMLKYQSKIEELRTSQESLLDQLESMENQEMTLQEKMQEMERTLRGKIVTLEVEMKGFKQKELKHAARIRELEKSEKELSEKMAQQAEKENGLYVKISSLMDQLKTAKEKAEHLQVQLADKEDKVRKAQLLDVKRVEAEMEYGKKVSDMSTKLRHKEEEMRVKDAAHKEEVANLQNEISTLQAELSIKESEKNQRISILQRMFAQKENDLQSKIAILEENNKELTAEKLESEAEIRKLKENNSELLHKDTGYEKEMDILREEVTFIQQAEKEHENKVVMLEENIRKEKHRADEAEKKVVLLEKEVSREKDNVLAIESKLIALKGDIAEKMRNIESSFIEKESEYEKEIQSLQQELDLKVGRVKELEKEQTAAVKRVKELEAECAELKSKAASSESGVKVQMLDLEKQLKEKNKLIDEMKESNERKEKELKSQLDSMKAESHSKEQEMNKKITFLNTQLLQEVETRESLENSKSQSESKEVSELKKEVSELRKEVGKHKQELVQKLKELEEKNRELSELRLELSNMKLTHKTLLADFHDTKDKLLDTEKKFQKIISERDQELQRAQEEISKLSTENSQKENLLKNIAQEKDKIIEENRRELDSLREERKQRESLATEHIQKSESLLLQSQQSQEMKETELKRITRELEEKRVLLQECCREKDSLVIKVEELQAQVKNMEVKLSETSQTAEKKSLEAKKYQENLEKLLEEQTSSKSELKEMEKNVKENQTEVEKKALELSNSQQLISAKQLELAQARSELQKCLEEIEQIKNLNLKEKEQFQQQDQTYKKMSADYEELNLRYEEKDQDQKHLKVKVADVELKLVEAENRYRELEARCASLEMQLEERFAQHQEAQKVIQMKEEMCHKLERQLEIIETDYEAATTQVQEAEKFIINRDKDFKQLQSRLERVSKENDEIKTKLKEREAECQIVKEQFFSLEQEHDQIKVESLHLQHAYTESQKGHQVNSSEVKHLKDQLVALQSECKERKAKLEATEDQLLQVSASCKKLEAELKIQTDHAVTLQEDARNLEKKWKETETLLKSSQQSLKSYESQVAEKDKEIKNLKFNINGKDVLITESKSKLAKAEESLKFSEEKCQKLNEKLIQAEEKLAENSQLIPELTSRISTVEAALKEKESFCRDSQSGLNSLEQQYMEAKAECERLRSEVIQLQKQVDATRITCVEAESNLKEVKFNLKNSEISLIDSKKQVVELENTNKHLVSQLEHLSKTAADCDKKVEQLKGYEEKYLKASSELGDLHTQISYEVEKYSHLETQFTQVRQDAESKSTALVHLESSNAELVSALRELEQANAGLKSRLQEMESNHQSNETHFNQLEETNQNLAGKLYKLRETFNDCTNRLAVAEENNSKLKRDKDEAVSRAGDLREQIRQLEARKKELEEKVELFKAENMKTQELEKSYSQAEDSRIQLEEKIIQLAQEVSELKQEKIVLEDKLREEESKNIALSKEVSMFEVHHEETLSKMEQMKVEFEAFRAKDRTNEDKLKMVEKNLKELKDKKLSERVVELESKEKQLLEQIADIENTVIVPLEAENQELKDELSVVKQERDDAISRASRWGEDEVDMESLHKSLEDSLIHRDELEKKLHILNEDVAKLESEKESLMKQVSDFESSVSEYKDKIELLEDEVERLHHFEKQSSVVEEAETRLMDRVLDLEEREQMLLAELDNYKLRKVSSVVVQTEELSHGDLAERLKYLEQKNEVLQDAEGKYMDKIMELEETQYRLQAEVQSLKSGGGSEHPSLSVSVSATSTAAVLDKAADMRCVSTDTVGLLSASAQTFAKDDLSLHCRDLESQNQRLLVECEEKSQKVQYLENKIELLHESEARLMDKLEECVGAGISEDVSELKGKITNLTEENEFLAENVEKYKQLYKEEKEKMNELQDRLLEESSLYQELQEKEMELESVQKMLEELEDKVSEFQARSRELHSQLDAARQDNTELRMKLEQLSTNKQASKEEELQNQKKELTQQFEIREHELCREIKNLKEREEELHIRHEQQTQRLREEAESASEREQGLIRELEALKLQLGDQEKEMILLQQREVILLKKVDSMEKQDLNNKLSSLEDSMHSDSGLSADDQKFRYDQFERDLRERTATPAQEIFSSRATLSLSRPGVQSPDSHPSHTTTPVAPPRKSKSRQASIDSSSQEELSQLVEELQHKVAAQKKRILDLESAADTDLYGRVQELECMNHNLERRLRYAEGLRLSSAEEGKYSSFYLSGDNNNNNTETSVKRSSSYNMLDKPEDILQQKIRDLENLDKHNKNQLSELEHDREILHEIARKDKSTIHDLQVKIRELQLTERSLKEQVNSLEISEGSLFTKCEELTSVKSQLEDRVHELEIHERRLRELVRRLKLDEEHWLSKSGGMENAVAELSASETQLRKLLQNIEMEKGGLFERARYLEARVGELETVELTLLQKLKNFEINEVTLKNRLVQLENSEAAAHSKATELDVVNVDLSQRLQKAVEECAMLSQHVSQLQGQIQDLDRRLLSSKDSELAYKHHVESLQKNESLLQKKVREYELREIDSQASVRELEQNNRILNDKLGALQRSENKLKFRVQELEGLTGQVPGELSPEQKKKVPQKLEDCQKFVIVLQKQVENLQLQLREAVTPTQLASQTKESGKVSIPVDEYNELQTKSVLLEESTYQVEELEQLHQQLSDTILQLRQGKDASGHEVEVEVLKRRLNSYKTLINQLKSSLSKGQATSLLDPEQDSGPLGSTLPAHTSHGLESERVLQAVRSNQNGKADTSKVGGAQLIGPQTQEISIVQSTDKSSLSSPPANMLGDVIKKFEQPSSREESHWKAIEARKPKEVAGLRGETKATVGATAKPAAAPGSKRSSTPEVGEVTVALHLQSESELSSHHRTTQNDTDSCDSPVPPPRRGRVFRAGKNSSSESQSAESDDLAKPAAAANNKHYFGNEKSLPTSANTSQRTRRAPLTRFGDDSFYLPSSAQEGVDSLDDGEAPPLPSTEPPGVVKARSSQVLTQPLKLDTEDSMESSTSGLSIRERIAMIEKQLQSDNSGSKADYEQILNRKKRPNDNLKQAEAQERDNKYLKDDINRLERELEEKRRFIHLVELWLLNLEELLKNKTKQTDREMLECLQRDLTKLRSELRNVGYRSEDAVLDAAALKTELEHRDRDIVTKRHEVEALSQELRRCQEECQSIEGMRRTALDSLRSLEKEVIDLQETEVRLKEAQAEIQTLKLQTEKTQEVYAENLSLRDRLHQSELELIRLRNLCDDYNNLSARYDELENYKSQALNMLQPLQAKLDRMTLLGMKKDDLLNRLRSELRHVTYRPSSALHDLMHMDHMDEQGDYTGFSPSSSPPQRHKIYSRSASADDLELSDTGSSNSVPGTKKKRPSPYAGTRPRSADNMTTGSMVRGTHAHPRPLHGTRRSEPPLAWPGVSRGQFIALADYEPALFSQSGRPGLELQLREGDCVIVTGPMDRTGYYEAEVNGRTGLVPANYLEPLSGSEHMIDYNMEPWLLTSPTHVTMSSPTQVTETKVKDGSFTRYKETNNKKIGTVSQNGQSFSMPDPPQHLHVKGVGNDRSLLLSWSPPKLDKRGNTNGFKLLGYMVYLNNQAYEQISSPKLCEVVVEGLTPGSHQLLAVQCLCAGGQVSPRAELVLEGVVKLMDSQAYTEPASDAPDTDLSSVLNSVHYKRGHRKAVMALYDYSPKHQSPHDYTVFELAFMAGDIIYVYGEPRPDGFYHGEMDGNRGLVPACFVEDVSHMTNSMQRGGRELEPRADTTS